MRRRLLLLTESTTHCLKIEATTTSNRAIYRVVHAWPVHIFESLCACRVLKCLGWEQPDDKR